MTETATGRLLGEEGRRQIAALDDPGQSPSPDSLKVSDDEIRASLTGRQLKLTRCVTEFGFVGCNVNPDPIGGYWRDPPLFDRSWYPLWEKTVELDVPGMIHVSASANPNFQATGAHYIAGDTTAFMQFITSDLFRDFPTLRLIIPHGGGAVPYHWGRYRGLAQDMKRPPLTALLRNVYFDTCVYHQPGIDLLTKVVPADNILFASEMVGAVNGIDPERGTPTTTPSATWTPRRCRMPTAGRCFPATRSGCTRGSPGARRDRVLPAAGREGDGARPEPYARPRSRPGIVPRSLSRTTVASCFRSSLEVTTTILIGNGGST